LGENVKTDIETNAELKKAEYEYQQYISTFIEGYVTKLFNQGIINEVSAETLKKYFSDPDNYQKQLANLTQYYYISSAEIHQMYELIEALPTLNYKVDSFVKNKNNDKYIATINKKMHQIKHKRLTRDILKQTASQSGLVGIWLGDKNNLYPYIFDDLQFAFPSYRKNGEWQCVVDLDYFSKYKEDFRNIQLENLSPYVTRDMYDKYMRNKDPKDQYIELPQDRTFVVNTGTLMRNQGLGTSWSTPGFYDVLHKKKLKDVESAIANKIINAIAVLTIGFIKDEKYDDLTNLKLPRNVKQKVHNGVKAALEKNQTNGVTLLSIPDFAKLEFPDVKADGLDGKKFDHINNDIQTAYGLSGAILNGNGGNFASAKLNLDIFYKRIGVLLENIEQEVYQKMINLILPSSQKDNFYIVYDKEPPLTLKEKIDILMKLNDKGWSIKHVIDNINGINWESYLEQTLYETDVLKLQDKIRPYQSSYTMSTDGENGRPSIDDPTNENTIKSKTIDGNNLPE
jgi:hypothetical protein